MQVKTVLFERYPNYTMKQLASIVGVSLSQVYRIKCGDRKVTATFIAGVLKGFPEAFEELFYVEEELK